MSKGIYESTNAERKVQVGSAGSQGQHQLGAQLPVFTPVPPPHPMSDLEQVPSPARHWFLIVSKELDAERQDRWR